MHLLDENPHATINITDDLRKLIYQINPNDLMCLYKPTFEKWARRTLLSLDGDGEKSTGVVQDEEIVDESYNTSTSKLSMTPINTQQLQQQQQQQQQQQSQQQPPPPPQQQQQQSQQQRQKQQQQSSAAQISAKVSTVGSSPSLHASGARSSVSNTKKGNDHLERLQGWMICSRSHTEMAKEGKDIDTYMRLVSTHRRSRSAGGKLDARRSSITAGNSGISLATTTSTQALGSASNPAPHEKSVVARMYYGPSRIAAHAHNDQCQDVGEEERACHSAGPGAANSGLVAGYSGVRPCISYYGEFQHFDHFTQYIDQYRQEYTYKKFQRGNRSQTYISNSAGVSGPAIISYRHRQPVTATQARRLESYQLIGSPVSRLDTCAQGSVCKCQPRVMAKAQLFMPKYKMRDIRNTSGTKTKKDKRPSAVVSEKCSDTCVTSGSQISHNFDFLSKELAFSISGTPRSKTSRTRPSIPSNSHGSVHPTSMETQIYIIPWREHH